MNEMKFVIGFLIIVISGSHPILTAEIFTHLGQCCNEGKKWAIDMNICVNYENAIENIPDVWRGLCLSTFGICCSKELNVQHCAAGRLAAKQITNCDGKNIYNSTAYKNCCKACQIGLAVATSGNNCSSPFFSYLANDESYEICCTEMNASDTFELSENDDICGKISKLCSHICENTEDSYICKCPTGYKLDDNRVTCTKLNNTNNIINNNENEDEIDNNNDDENDDDDDDDDDDENEYVGRICPKGYLKNVSSNDCEDIDECSTGEANCKPTQYCYNIDGSFNCLNIKSTSCENGYRFNTQTEQCEDINECIEESHNCKRLLEICINTIGNYECKEKSTRKYFDECLDNPCDDGYTCINYPGHYECTKTISPIIRDRQGILISNQQHHHLINEQQQQQHKCGPGYRFKHNKCIDIDECLTDKNACDSNQLCTNEQGGYRCDCKIGFKMDATVNACIDINECQINNHNCLPTQRCDNTIGSYTCIRLQSCGTGYTLNAETGNCDDDDECELGTHDCPNGYECRNTMGSFRCDRIRLTRPTATTKTTTTTTTKRPKIASTLRFQQQQQTSSTSTSTSTSTTTSTTIPPKYSPSRSTYYSSTNYPSRQQQTGYVSSQTHSKLNTNYLPTSTITQRFRPDPSCGYGFQRNPMGACIDIDECHYSDVCGSHQRCINTNGSYRCQNLLLCSGGYKSTPDGQTCVDIDECQTGEHNCGPDQICRNRMGGYICSCPSGHILNNLNRCIDINECEYQRDQVCPINSNCINTIGSYRCECKNGFKKQYNFDNDRTCIDIDECNELHTTICEQKCINFWGSYRCACNPGYELNLMDNRTCNDIDECKVHKSYNLCMGYCNNIPGSYQCSCPNGYELGMDKNSCRDIDECSIPTICNGRNEICTNIRGSYRCTTIQCPYGYTIDSDQKNRCKIISNVCEDSECYQRPASYTYNFITLISKMLIPPQGRTLFTLRGPSWYENIDFDLKIAKTQAPPNVEKATEQHFSTTKQQNQVQLSLMKSIEGPQDIELELSMTVFMNGQPQGKSIAKIIIIVSQYSF